MFLSLAGLQARSTDALLTWSEMSLLPMMARDCTDLYPLLRTRTKTPTVSCLQRPGWQRARVAHARQIAADFGS